MAGDRVLLLLQPLYKQQMKANMQTFDIGGTDRENAVTIDVL